MIYGSEIKDKEIIHPRTIITHCGVFRKVNIIRLSACFDSYGAYNTVTSF
jgi:hypothetical protein